jgi:hypothetical protein
MSAAVMIAINCLVVTVFFFVRIRKRPFNILDCAWAFLAGYFINYCFRPTLFLLHPDASLWYEDALHPAPEFRVKLAGALVFALIGLAGFITGDLGCERLAARVARCLPEPGLHVVARDRFYSVLATLFLLAGVAGLWGFIRQAGWSGSILALLTGYQRDSFLALDVIQGHGYYLFAMQLSLFGWALLCAKWITYGKVVHGWQRLLRVLWRSACAIATLLIWVALGERSAILTVVFIPFALYLSMRTKSATAKKMLHWAPVFAIVFIAVAGPIGLLMKQQTVTGPQIANMATSAWDSMEFTVAAHDDFRVRDLFWGSSYVGDMFYTWYPRAIFTSKPERYGIVTVQDRMAPSLMTFPGTFPPGVLVEAFANFWYVGLFFIPLLWAVVCRAIYIKLQANSFYWHIQMVLLFSATVSFRSLGSVFAFFEANLLVLGFVILLCRLARFFVVAETNPMDLAVELAH